MTKEGMPSRYQGALTPQGAPTPGDNRRQSHRIARVSESLRAKAATASLPPLLLHEVAQLPLHRLERVVDDFAQRGMGAVVHLFFVGDEFVTRRNGDIDAHPELIPFVMRVIGLLDGDVTSVDVIAEFLEPSRLLQNELVDLLRLLEPPIGDVYWPLHS